VLLESDAAHLAEEVQSADDLARNSSSPAGAAAGRAGARVLPKPRLLTAAKTVASFVVGAMLGRMLPSMGAKSGAKEESDREERSARTPLPKARDLTLYASTPRACTPPLSSPLSTRAAVLSA